jgi:hypothetical protein
MTMTDSLDIEIISSSGSIETIFINNCPYISDGSFQYFKRIPLLGGLSLLDTSVTHSGLTGFKSARPDCFVSSDVR